jgi:hypothetical protein
VHNTSHLAGWQCQTSEIIRERRRQFERRRTDEGNKGLTPFRSALGNNIQQNIVDSPSTGDVLKQLYSEKCKINLNSELKEFSYVITTYTLKRLLLYYYLYNVVSIMNSHGPHGRVSIPCSSKRRFSTPLYPEQVWSPRNLLCSRHLVALFRSKAAGSETDFSHPSIDEVKNEWSGNTTTPLALMASQGQIRLHFTMYLKWNILCLGNSTADFTLCSIYISFLLNVTRFNQLCDWMLYHPTAF